MTRTDRAAKGYFANVIQIVLFIALQAVLAPLVLKLAGVPTLGAFGALMQVVAYFTLFDMACSMTLARYMAQSHGTSAIDRFRSIFTTGRTCLLLSGITLAVIGVLLAGRFADLLRLPEAVAAQTRISVYLLAAWFLVRTPLASYDDALTATQNLATANTIIGLKNATRVLGSLVAVLAGAGLVGMIAAAIAADLAAGLFSRRYFFRNFPDRRPGWGFPDRHLLVAMLKFTGRALVAQLSTMLTFASGQLIAGHLLGAAAVAIIYTNQLPAQMAHNLIMRLSDNASPAINELFGRSETARLRDAFFRIQRLTLNLSIPLAFAFLFFNRSLIGLWVGPQQYGGTGMTIALAALTVVVSIEHVNVVFSMACGLERIVARFSIAEAVAAVTLSYVLGRAWGVAGIPAGVTIAIVPKAIYLGMRLQAASGVSFWRYLRTCVLPATAASTLALAAAWPVARTLGMASWPTAALAAAAYCAMYALACYLIGLTAAERAIVRRYAAAARSLVSVGPRVRPLGLDAQVIE